MTNLEAINQFCGTSGLRQNEALRLFLGESGPMTDLDCWREIAGMSGDTIIATETPASASATGTTGQIAWDADYIYICTATDTWKRVAISTW